MGEVESEVVADESDMMDVGSVASRWREFGLRRRTFSSVPENDHLSELLPFCLSERGTIDGWNNDTCENGGRSSCAFLEQIDLETPG